MVATSVPNLILADDSLTSCRTVCISVAKQQLVLVKTTACFNENDGSFFLPFNEGGKKRIAEYQFVKETFSAPSRAYAYTRITGVFTFLLSQVSRRFCKVFVLQVFM